MIKYFLPRIHRDGWVFIAIFVGVSLAMGAISDALGWIGAVLTGWCIYFFRDPERMTPIREHLVVSPADGLVQSVTLTSAPKEMELPLEEYKRVSIFLSVFDVHVNRIPIAGSLVRSVYHAGKFFNASLDKASIHNERHSYVVETKSHGFVGFVQIAGLIARRIRSDVVEGQEVKTGERFGIIRFGSRVDIYLPTTVSVHVIPGQRVIGGETIIADFLSQESDRIGEER